MRNVKVIGMKATSFEFIKIFNILEARKIEFNRPDLNIGWNIIEFIYSDDDDSNPDELISVRKLQYIDNYEDEYIFDETLTAKEFLSKKLHVSEDDQMVKKTKVSEELFEAVQQAKRSFSGQSYKFSALGHDNIDDLVELYSVFREYEVSTGHSFSNEDEELLIKYLLFDGENPFIIGKSVRIILEAIDDDGDYYWFMKDEYGRSTFTENIDYALEFNSLDEAEKFQTGNYYTKQV